MAPQEHGNEGNFTGDPQARSPASIAHALQGIDFPQDKDGMKEYAQQNGADESVMNRIDEMPDGEYGSMADVFKGVGEADNE